MAHEAMAERRDGWSALRDEEVVSRVLAGDHPLFEVLMRRYYWAAKAVGQLNLILMLNIEERVDGSGDRPMRPINERFFDRGGMLEVASDDLYEREPHAILETFLIYQ